MRSHWAGPVWGSRAHTTPPGASSPGLCECSCAFSQGYISISFSAPWATHRPFLLAHWPLANHSTPLPEPQRLGTT